VDASEALATARKYNEPLECDPLLVHPLGPPDLIRKRGIIHSWLGLILVPARTHTFAHLRRSLVVGQYAMALGAPDPDLQWPHFSLAAVVSLNTR
jgi:hypothetical protein